MAAPRDIVVLAHNIRSLWNVGSIFRSADAFAVSHVYLTGYTAVPPRKEISKTALGAEQWVPWSYENDVAIVIDRCRQQGFDIVALECTKTSEPIWQQNRSKSICLVLGHEVLGVSEELLALCDSSMHIPMSGKKNSLNVSVACGIALYEHRRLPA